MTKAKSDSLEKNIEKSLFVVDPDSPLDTLPFISDALICMATFFQLEPALNKTTRAEMGAGLLLDLLAYAVDDVQDALEEKYLRPKKG